jgi:uncharacterized protein YraI
MPLRPCIMLGTGLFIFATVVANAATVTVKNQSVLRAGPGPTFSVIGHIPAGTQLETGECPGGWCQVGFNGVAGFVEAPDLRTARRTGNSPRDNRVSHRSTPGDSVTRASRSNSRSKSSAHALAPPASPPAHP